MLNLTNIFNTDIADLKSKDFDLGIFSSGYESRSSFLAKNLNPNQFKHKLIIGFEEHSGDSVRRSNDEYYVNNYIEPIVISSHDQEKIYSELRNIFIQFKNQTRISLLVDYTSMARLWYSGILNFLRVHEENEIDVYINYSVGLYRPEFLDYPYSSINSLPELEGSLSSNNKTLLVIAIGFSPFLVRSVIEEIEPNYVIGILPTPNIISEYDKQAQIIKSEVLSNDIDDWIHSPINDLESIFRTYAEITSFNINEKDIIFLSLGLKIFTIASILVSQRFDQVTCLYLKSKRNNNDVEPSGEFICNKIHYRPQL